MSNLSQDCEYALITSLQLESLYLNDQRAALQANAPPVSSSNLNKSGLAIQIPSDTFARINQGNSSEKRSSGSNPETMTDAAKFDKWEIRQKEKKEALLKSIQTTVSKANLMFDIREDQDDFQSSSNQKPDD